MDQHGNLLADIDEQTIYEAALTVMMRLVFLLSAEEQGLLLLGDPIYDQNYAISTLRAQLQEAADLVGEEVIQRRTDAWARLLAAFRAVYTGIRHPQLSLPAYGGTLFDPDRFPFLEGRTARQPFHDAAVSPLQIDNRTVLHLLQALQQLELKTGGVTTLRTLSFRALGVEQIGHVYEGLLDHQAVRATKVVLGIAGAARLEPEIPLSVLEAEAAKGDKALLAFLKAETKRTQPSLKKGMAAALSDLRRGRLLTACGGDEALFQRVLPYAGLLRDDTRNEPLVILPGEVYVTAGLTRRQTGSHYTPRSLTEPIVQHTLEPLVYHGPAEGLPREEWQLQPAAELLQLKVCDMAMGSGAFLVQACRYLAERLLEAWQAEDVASSDATYAGKSPYPEKSPHPEEVASADAALRGGQRASEDARLLNQEEEKASADAARRDGQRASEDARLLGGEEVASSDATLHNVRLLSLEPTANRPFAGPVAVQNLDELYTLAKRLVAERCLYGVDKNPLAVEMAKLSLWLVTLSKNKPFTFVDHALRHGDSLIGTDEDAYNRWWHNLKGTVGPLYGQETDEALREARRLRRELQEMQVLDVQDAQRKAALLVEAKQAASKIQRACDLLIGIQLLGLSKTDQDAWQQKLLIEHVGNEDLTSHEAQQALTIAKKHDAFHWFVEFPEVFARGGFSAFVGNPPFIGGQRISGHLGDDYLASLKHKWNHAPGSADYCTYFFLKGFQYLKPQGTLGLLATNTIGQGDSRDLGLTYLCQNNGIIFRAINNHRWPGQAAVFVSLVYLMKGTFLGIHYLDDQKVSHITPSLDDLPLLDEPQRLAFNFNKSFVGSYIHGAGFTMSSEEAEELINKDKRNAQVLFPYLRGQDFNSSPVHAPSKWVINFFDWSLAYISHVKKLIER